VGAQCYTKCYTKHPNITEIIIITLITCKYLYRKKWHLVTWIFDGCRLWGVTLPVLTIVHHQTKIMLMLIYSLNGLRVVVEWTYCTNKSTNSSSEAHGPPSVEHVKDGRQETNTQNTTETLKDHIMFFFHFLYLITMDSSQVVILN